MIVRKENDLRKKIIAEMTADYSSALEKNFNLARQYVRITTDGKVDVLIKDTLTGKETILLYLIGKLYAKEAGYSATDDVGNEELMDELGVRKGSLLPWLKELRDNKQVKQIKRGKYTYHAIMLNEVESTLKDIAIKIEKST